MWFDIWQFAETGNGWPPPPQQQQMELEQETQTRAAPKFRLKTKTRVFLWVAAIFLVPILVGLFADESAAQAAGFLVAFFGLLRLLIPFLIKNG